MQEIDQRDRELLNALQSEVPLVSTPYAVVGQLVDMSEKEVIKRAERLKREGVLRQISGVFDSRSLGYRSCLVAGRVDGDDIERSASIINTHPGVSQNYKRNHEFNLWFTIAVPPNSKLGLERTVDVLGEEAQCTTIRMFPTLKLFKSGSDGSDSLHESIATADGAHDERRETLSEREIDIIRILQRDLPLQPRPFDALARSTSVVYEELMDTARAFQKRQLMRRYCATAQSRKPFSAGVMGVWAVPPDRVDDVGAKMVAHRSVSQCYLRPIYSDWPYNVFTTVHGRSVDECESVLNEIASETGIGEMRALFPLKEFKKTRISLFAPENEAWENTRLGNRAESAAS